MITPLDNDTVLTQAGAVCADGGRNFQHGLKSGADDVSLVRGEIAPAEVIRIVNFTENDASIRRRIAKGAARYATVARLGELDFEVKSTPTPMNLDHVSVFFSDGEWDARVAERFCRAFHLTVKGGGSNE